MRKGSVYIYEHYAGVNSVSSCTCTVLACFEHTDVILVLAVGSKPDSRRREVGGNATALSPFLVNACLCREKGWYVR